MCVCDIQQTDPVEAERTLKLLIPPEDDGSEERTKSTHVLINGGENAMLQSNE